MGYLDEFDYGGDYGFLPAPKKDESVGGGLYDPLGIMDYVSPSPSSPSSPSQLPSQEEQSSQLPDNFYQDAFASGPPSSPSFLSGLLGSLSGAWNAVSPTRALSKVVDPLRPGVSTVGTAMESLGNTLRGGIQYAKGQSEDPDLKTALWRHLIGQEHTKGEQIFGLTPADPTVDNPLQLAYKNALGFAADQLTTPENYLFGTGPIMKGLGLAKGGVGLVPRAVKAAGGNELKRMYAESPVFKAVGHSIPKDIEYAGIKSNDVNAAVDRAMFEYNTRRLNQMAIDTKENLQPVEEAFIQRFGEAPSDLEKATAIEFRGKPLPKFKEIPEEVSMTGAPTRPPISSWTEIPEELRDWSEIYEPFRQELLGYRRALIGKQKKLGVEPSRTISEERLNYNPREVIEGPKDLVSTERKPGYRLGEMRIDPKEFEFSRDLMAWENANGEVKTIGQWDHPNTGIEIEQLPGGKGNIFKYQGEEVFPRQASTYEIQEAFPNIKYEGDLFKVGIKKGGRDLARLGYLDIMDKLTDTGAARNWPIKPGESPRTPTELDEIVHQLGNAPPQGGFSKLNVKGIPEDVEVVDFAKQHLQNLGQTVYDPTSEVDALTNAMRALNLKGTKTGKALGDAETWFKRSVLATHPSFHTGNITSSVGLGFDQGVWNPRVYRESAILRNPRGHYDNAPEIFPGMSNKVLEKELTVNRPLGQGALYGETGDLPTGYGGKTKAFAEKFEPGTTSRKAADLTNEFAEAAGWVQSRGFDVAGEIESTFRRAAALDFLHKNYPNLGKMPRGEQTRALDEAARFGQDTHVDYSYLTPFEREIPMPFYKWQRGMTGLTLSNLATHPERMIRQSQILNRLFTPLSEFEFANASEADKEGMPVKGVMGVPLGETAEGKPNILRLQRYVSRGNLEGLFNNPFGWAFGNIAPIKQVIPDILSNYDIARMKKIDPETSPGMNLIGPLVGANYSPQMGRTMGMALPETWAKLYQAMPWNRYSGELEGLLTTAGKLENPYREKMSWPQFLAWYMTGGKTYNLDVPSGVLGNQAQARERKAYIEGRLKKAALAEDQPTFEKYLKLLVDYESTIPGKMGLLDIGDMSREGDHLPASP